MNSADREQAKILGQYLKESAKDPRVKAYPGEVDFWIKLADLALNLEPSEEQRTEDEPSTQARRTTKGQSNTSS